MRYACTHLILGKSPRCECESNRDDTVNLIIRTRPSTRWTRRSRFARRSLSIGGTYNDEREPSYIAITSYLYVVYTINVRGPRNTIYSGVKWLLTVVIFRSHRLLRATLHLTQTRARTPAEDPPAREYSRDRGSTRRWREKCSIKKEVWKSPEEDSASGEATWPPIVFHDAATLVF